VLRLRRLRQHQRLQLILVAQPKEGADPGFVRGLLRSPNSESGILVRPFAPDLDRSTFSCGEDELDHWLRTQAGQQERRGNTRTFLAIDLDDDFLVGYYSTTTYRLELDEAAEAFGMGRRRYPVPAVLLARLAVDTRRQGEGLGHGLLLHALYKLAKASSSIGFEVVVTHAINKDAAVFYRHAGFQPYCDHELHLFMPIKDVRATFGDLMD
jgi:GNAT superfamily N-acetyltransferase